MMKHISFLILLLAGCAPCWGQKTNADKAFAPPPIVCGTPASAIPKPLADRLFTGLPFGTMVFGSSTVIICDGNSITAASQGGLTDAADSYPRQLAALTRFANVSAVYNLGVGGQRTADMIADFNAQVLPLVPVGKKGVYIAWEVSNDMADGATPERVADVYGRYVTLCQMAQAAGYAVIAFKSVPRSSTFMAGVDGNLDARLRDVDALIEANWRTFANGIVRPRADSRIATIGAGYPTWIPDGIHPSAACFSTIIVPMVETVLLELGCR